MYVYKYAETTEFAVQRLHEAGAFWMAAQN